MEYSSGEGVNLLQVTHGSEGPLERAGSGPPSVASPSDKPFYSSRTGEARRALSLRALWDYRELLYFLTLRDVKVRYKQTALGVAWVLIQPLFTTVIFAIFFGLLVGVPSDGLPYPLFIYAGLLPWTFFSGTVVACSGALINNTSLITKVYFPRVLVPAAVVAAGLLDLAVASVTLIGLAVYYEASMTWWGLAMVPVLLALTISLALGVGLLLAALTVKYRDIRHALPFAIQTWMFITPIIYPLSLVPVRWRWLLVLNPFTGIVEGFRSALGGRAFDWPALLVSAVISVAILIGSTLAFRRIERDFADLV